MFELTLTDSETGNQLNWEVSVYHAPYYIGMFKTEFGTPTETIKKVGTLQEAVRNHLDSKGTVGP